MWASNLFLKSENLAHPQILDSFRFRKSANLLGMPVCKSQIRIFLWLIRKSQICKFLQNNAQFCLKAVLKVVFLHNFLLSTNFNWSLICYICNDEEHVFADLRKFLSPEIAQKIGSANRKSAKGHICVRTENITNYLFPPFCGFANCGTYLRFVPL